MADKPATTKALLLRAEALARAGRREEAATTYRAILARFPSNAQARSGLAALTAAGSGPAGLASGLAAVQAAIAANRPAEALERLRPLLSAQPGEARLHLLAGAALAALGRAEPALAAYRAALARQPGLVLARFGAGNMLYLLGQFEQAATEFAAVIKAEPAHRDAQNNLGLALHRAGRLAEAAAAYGRAVDLAPANADYLCNLGLALHELGRFDEAVACYGQARALNPSLVRAAYNLGNSLTELGRADEAIAAYRAALALDPGYAEAANNLGNVLRDSGDKAGAVAAYRQALAHRPGMAVYLRNLSDLHRFAADDPLLGQITAELAAAKTDSDRMYLNFALAKARDDLGEVDQAFAAFAAANRLRKAELGYDIESDVALFATLRRYFEGAVPAPPLPGPAQTRPIFILGMIRSGTSLVEQILGSHSQVRSAGELEFLTRLCLPVMEAAHANPSLRIDAETAGDVARRYRVQLARLAGGAAVVTDKMPLNFRWIGFILAAFPDARIVHLNRDPMAVGWSAFRHFFAARGNGYAYDLDDIGRYIRLHDSLMAYWHQVFPGRIMELGYEALTEDQEGETRRLLDACGLPFEQACLNFHETPGLVRTASSAQVRQKMYRGSSDEWRRYEAHLAPLRAALGRPA